MSPILKLLCLYLRKLINKRNSKNPPLTDDGYMVCEAGIKMLKDGKQYFDGFIKQKIYLQFL